MKTEIQELENQLALMTAERDGAVSLLLEHRVDYAEARRAVIREVVEWITENAVVRQRNLVIYFTITKDQLKEWRIDKRDLG